jgi:pimeloyl-ACP methyl ester carboxylesterase
MDQAIHHCRTADGGDIAYATVGDGPPLVLTSWWVSHVELDWSDSAFRTFVETLAQRHLVVRYDRPGAGLSGPRRGALSLQDEVGYALAVIDDLNLERYALFGTSCGGPTAVAIAAERPDAVTQLVLYGTYARGATIADSHAQDALVKMVESVWGVGIRALTDVFLRGASAAGTAAFLARQRATASPQDAAQLLRLTFILDAADKAPAVRAPTLVLHREFDPAIRISHGRDLARRIPGARFVALPGETHVPWEGESEAVLRQTELFLTGTAPVLSTGRQVLALLAVRGPAMDRTAGTTLLSVVSRFGGRVTRSDPASTLVVFDLPSAAVGCARALSTELAAAAAVSRLGLHAGEVAVWREGVDGLAVDVADAVAAVAEPGEIWCTGTVAELIAGEGVSWHDRGTVELRAGLGAWRLVTIGSDTSRSAVSEAQVEPCFRRDGSVWTLVFGGVVARLPDRKGLADLHTLLANPGVAIPAMTLAGEPEHSGAEPILDDAAVAAYRARLSELDAELRSADAVGDVVLARTAGAERDNLLAELRTASGLSGRARRLGDPSERARKAVTARVRDAIARIVAVHPDLGAHLRASIRTGTTCMYEPARRVAWRL